MHVVSRQRRVVMIRTDRTGKRTVAMAVRMHILVVAPGRGLAPTNSADACPAQAIRMARARAKITLALMGLLSMDRRFDSWAV